MIDHRDIGWAFVFSGLGFFAAGLLFFNCLREITAAFASPNQHGGLTS